MGRTLELMYVKCLEKYLVNVQCYESFHGIVIHVLVLILKWVPNLRASHLAHQESQLLRGLLSIMPQATEKGSHDPQCGSSGVHILFSNFLSHEHLLQEVGSGMPQPDE